jgi:hypothetical protein
LPPGRNGERLLLAHVENHLFRDDCQRRRITLAVTLPEVFRFDLLQFLGDETTKLASQPIKCIASRVTLDTPCLPTCSLALLSDQLAKRTFDCLAQRNHEGVFSGQAIAPARDNRYGILFCWRQFLGQPIVVVTSQLVDVMTNNLSREPAGMYFTLEAEQGVVVDRSLTLDQDPRRPPRIARAFVATNRVAPQHHLRSCLRITSDWEGTAKHLWNVRVFVRERRPVVIIEIVKVDLAGPVTQYVPKLEMGGELCGEIPMLRTTNSSLDRDSDRGSVPARNSEAFAILLRCLALIEIAGPVRMKLESR